MFRRYAVYYTPQGPLATKGAAWLGWDLAAGAAVAHPGIEGLELAGITAKPRKYGFHGTIKPPMSLDTGASRAGLEQAFADFCAAQAPVNLEGLEVSRMGRFLALTPLGDQAGLNALAAETVRTLDEFRAPPPDEELARRRQRRLSSAQEKNLKKWGYPFVMDEFRFHMTLTGPLLDAQAQLPRVAAHFDPVLPRPFLIETLTLVGEAGDGLFHEIRRCALGG